ncbi:hypothetical protein AB3R30_13010 [Leptolyngbyaceae cyanobacterium UHCC 1019]
MHFSSFLRTASIAATSLACVVAADIQPAFAFQFTPIDENNALVSFDGVTQIPYAKYSFSGTLEPQVAGTFNLPGLGLVTLPGFQGGNPAVPPEIKEAAVQAIADRYTFTSFVGSYFAPSSPGTINSIFPQSVNFTGAQTNFGTSNFELSLSKLTPTGVVIYSSDLVLTLSNPSNPSECSQATAPFCGAATFDFGIAQTLQNVLSYSVSPTAAAVPEPNEMAGSAIAIGFLSLGWYLKRKSAKPLL